MRTQARKRARSERAIALSKCKSERPSSTRTRNHRGSIPGGLERCNLKVRRARGHERRGGTRYPLVIQARRARKTAGRRTETHARRQEKNPARGRGGDASFFRRRQREDAPGQKSEATRARTERHAGTGGINFQRARARAGREDARKRTAPQARGRGGTVERDKRTRRARQGSRADRGDRFTNAEPQQIH